MSDAAIDALRGDDDSQSGSESSDEESTEDENEDEKSDDDEEEEERSDDEETGSLDQMMSEDDEIGETENTGQQLSEDDSSEVCPICLNKFLGQELGLPENCDHTFCLQCIVEWSKNVNTCPIDRIEFSNILMKLELLGNVVKKVKVKVKAREPEDALPIDNTVCEVCRSGDREDRLLLCDSCDLAYHCDCLDPPLWRVPVQEWFCPPCARILNRGPHAVRSSGQRRVIPRTIVSETVRTRIQRLREILDNDDDDDFTESLPVQPRPSPRKPSTSGVVRRRRAVRRRYRRRTPKKPKVLARTKQSVQLYGKTKVRIDTGTKTKYRRRRRKTRRYRKRKTSKRTTKKTAKTRRALLASKPLTAPSTKQRIADHLGLCKPPSGHTMPYVKKGGSSLAGENTLLLFGNKYELIDFEDDSLEETSIEAKPPSIPSNPGPSGYSASNLDILGSIMADQSILHKDSTDITIGKDGSLKLKEPPTNKRIVAKNEFVKAESKNIMSEGQKTRVSEHKSAITKTETDVDGFKKPQPLIKKEKLIKGDQANSSEQHTAFLTDKKTFLNKASSFNNVQSYGVKSERSLPSTNKLHSSISSDSSDYREFQNRKHIDENTEKKNVCVKKIKSEKQEVGHHKRKIKVYRGENNVSKHQKKEKTPQSHFTQNNHGLEKENAFEQMGSSSTRWKSDTNSSLNASISTDVSNSNQSFLNCNSTINSYANEATTDTSSFTSLNTGCLNVTYTSNDLLQISKFKKEKVDHDSSEESIDIVNNTPVFDRQLFPLKAEPVDVKNVERSDSIDISENVQQNINCKSVKSEMVSTPEAGLDKNNLEKRENSFNANYLECTFESSPCPDPIVPKKHIKLEVSEKSDSESDMDIMITECNLASEEMQLCNFVDIDNSKLAIKIEGKRKISSQEDSDDEVQVLFQSSSEINNCRTKRKKFSNNLPDCTNHPVTLCKVKIEKVSDNEYMNVRSIQNSGNFEEPLSNIMPTSSKTSFSEQFHNTSDCDDLVNGSRQCTIQSQNIPVQESVKSERTVSPHSNIRGETCNILHDVVSVSTNNVSLPVNEVKNGKSSQQASHFDCFDKNFKNCHSNSVKGKIKSDCERNSNPPINSTQKKKAVMSKTDNRSLNLSHDKPARKVSSKSNISDNPNALFENDVDLPFNVKIKKEPIDPENDDLINISSDVSVKNVLRNSVSDFNCRNSARSLTNISIKTEPVEISEPENIGFASCSDFNQNVTTFLENDTLDTRESAQENINPSAAIKIKTEPVDSENDVIPNCYFYENLRNLRRSNISGDLKSVYKNTSAQLNSSVKDKLFNHNDNDAMHKSNADIIDCQEDRTVLSEMLQKHENMITSFSNDVLSNREPEHENDVSSLNATVRKESVSSDNVASDIDFHKSANFPGNRTLNNVKSCQDNVKSLLNVRKDSVVSDDGILPNSGTNQNKNNNAEIVFHPNKVNSPTPLLNVTVKKEHMSSDVTGVKKLSFGENDTLNEESLQGKNSAIPFNVQIKKEPLDSDIINHCKIKLEPKEEDVNLSNGPIDVKIKTEKPYFDHEDVKHDFGSIKKEFTEGNASIIAKQAQQSSCLKIKTEKSERKSIVPHENPFDLLETSVNADPKYIANGSFPMHKPMCVREEEKEKNIILPMNFSNREMPVNVNQKLTFNGRLSHNGQQTNIIPRYSCKTDTSAKPDKKIDVIKEPNENSITQRDAVKKRTNEAFINQEGSMTVSETDTNSSQEEQVKKIQTDTCDINQQLQMPANQNGGEGITMLLNPLCPVHEEDHTKLIGDNLQNDHKSHRQRMDKEKLEKKVKNEIAKILHPLYKNGTLTKKLYYSIEKKCLLKILGNCKGVFNPEKIKKLVCEYVTRMTKMSKAN